MNIVKLLPDRSTRGAIFTPRSRWSFFFFCDWIVFTHQQAGVSKKSVSGSTSSIRSKYIYIHIYVYIFFFNQSFQANTTVTVLYRYSFFSHILFLSVQRMHAKNSNNNSEDNKMADDDDTLRMDLCWELRVSSTSCFTSEISQKFQILSMIFVRPIANRTNNILEQFVIQVFAS